MEKNTKADNLTVLLDPHKNADKAWFLDLLDTEKQTEYEEKHVEAVMRALRIAHIRGHQRKIAEAREEIEKLNADRDGGAENYRRVGLLLAEIERRKKIIDGFRCFFDEPYFARMDLIDDKEGYNSYYIGKKGDVKLEIVDWRAPLAKRYYQKSRICFSINEYDYKTVLRRALRTKSGCLEDFKNEFLSVRDFLSAEEIAGRDEELIFDPFLREIIKDRKEEASVRDIIQTIQEKQYEIITCPEDKSFVLQGCAGSGKTMVLLHRLSYLMYNNENIREHDVLVITPSDSFNAFIDELAAVLELERVQTLTIQEYFLRVLENEKIYLGEKIDGRAKEPNEYLKYLYSDKFLRDAKKKLHKVYDSLYGLFTGEECREFIGQLAADCKRRLAAYESVKNASLRIRRAVLGEIKERKEGGLYYTKPFRELMNCVLEVDDFFEGTLKSEQAKIPAYFYRQLLTFYKSASFVAKRTGKIVAEAVGSLESLKTTLEKEILDLKRYRQKIGEAEVYVYADRIERRSALAKECETVLSRLRIIDEGNTAFAEFYAYIRGEKNFSAIGSGESFVDVARYFYREIVRKSKAAYGMEKGKLYPSDGYAICQILSLLGKRLTPKHAFVFVDEAQDISKGEYELLRRINDNARFNVFGDLEQRITDFRGVNDWKDVFPEFDMFTLNQNYRNTNQIVQYVSEELATDMQSIGFDGPPIRTLAPREVNAFFRDKKGLKALICSEADKEKYMRKAYCVLSEKGRVSRGKINLMTVYESKGLEFTTVAVAPENMSANERYIAYTRALKELAVIGREGLK